MTRDVGFVRELEFLPCLGLLGSPPNPHAFPTVRNAVEHVDQQACTKRQQHIYLILSCQC